jgi:hypothetical protein
MRSKTANNDIFNKQRTLRNIQTKPQKTIPERKESEESLSDQGFSQPTGQILTPK